jgi:hypothetical protein
VTIDDITRAVLAAESAPVTQWPLRILLMLALATVILAVLWAMRRGWKARGARQSDIAPPPDAPASLAAVEVAGVTGVFLGSTSHGDWLDRIVVHDLGVRSRAICDVGPEGVLLRREGARDVFVPTALLRAAGTARGIAGKAYERGGVLVVTWELGGRLVDTGFRADAADDQGRVLEVIEGLVGPDRSTDGRSTGQRSTEEGTT